jgi:hypothetical protein
MQEEWKVVPQHPNFRVSNLGRLQSNLSGEWRDRKLKVIQKGKKARNTTYLGWNAPTGEKLPSGQLKKVTLKIHQHVAALFLGPCPEGMLLLHRDDDRTNNCVDNLYYGTQSQNMKDMWANNKLKIGVIKLPDGRFAGSRRIP